MLLPNPTTLNSVKVPPVPQSVEDCCAEQLRAAKADISNRQQEVTRALTTVKDQTSVDWSILEEQRAELLQHVEASEQLVHSFLRDELQEDVPTGDRFIFLP